MNDAVMIIILCVSRRAKHATSFRQIVLAATAACQAAGRAATTHGSCWLQNQAAECRASLVLGHGKVRNLTPAQSQLQTSATDLAMQTEKIYDLAVAHARQLEAAHARGWERGLADGLQRRRSQDKRQSLAHAKWSVPKVASCWQIWTPSSCVPHPSCGSIARPGSATTPPPAVSPATSANGSRMISANPHAPSASQASQTRSPPRSPHGPAHVCRPWPRASQRRGGTPAGSGQRRRCGGPRAAALFGSPPPTHSCDHQHGHMSCTRTPPLRPQQCTQREGVGIAPAKFPPPPEANPHALCGVTSQNKAPPPRGAPIETSP
mmetsp:Transcript_130464/g.417439  ORF Transcript_130464/g.417439 Transcript_130464/m.417439 type:complete len:321 (-) Transcript_130464:634-1596(-)